MIPRGIQRTATPRVSRSSGPYAAALLLLLAGLGVPASAGAQVPARVDIRDGHGSVTIRNPSPRTLRIRMALHESDETGPRVRLLEEARATLWPLDFELPPGELQVVRLLVPEDAYLPGTTLRLDTRIIPVQPEPVQQGGTTARITLSTRILSRVQIH